MKPYGYIVEAKDEKNKWYAVRKRRIYPTLAMAKMAKAELEALYSIECRIAEIILGAIVN